MENLDTQRGDFKADDSLLWVIMHNRRGSQRFLADAISEVVDELLDGENELGPWVGVQVRDELHLIHPLFTACEGRA